MTVIVTRFDQTEDFKDFKAVIDNEKKFIGYYGKLKSQVSDNEFLVEINQHTFIVNKNEFKQLH